MLQQAALPRLRDPAAQLEQFARFHIRFHLDRPDAVFIAYMELRNLTEDNFARITEKRGRYEAVLADILEQGRAEGVFCVPDARVATRAVIAMLTGVTTWYRDSGALSRDAVESLYVQMVRGAVGV